MSLCLGKHFPPGPCFSTPPFLPHAFPPFWSPSRPEQVGFGPLQTFSFFSFFLCQVSAGLQLKHTLFKPPPTHDLSPEIIPVVKTFYFPCYPLTDFGSDPYCCGRSPPLALVAYSLPLLLDPCLLTSVRWAFLLFSHSYFLHFPAARVPPSQDFHCAVPGLGPFPRLFAFHRGNPPRPRKLPVIPLQGPTVFFFSCMFFFFHLSPFVV